MIPPTANQAGQVTNYDQLSAQAAGWLTPSTPAAATPTAGPVQSAAPQVAPPLGNLSDYQATMQKAEQAAQAAPKAKPLSEDQLQSQAAQDWQEFQSQVTAKNPPKTLEQAGVTDTDTAEQLQFLQNTIDRSSKRGASAGGLPEGFDLKQDYQKRPQFYAKLFDAIKKGIPDTKNPGQRRKLSMDEILTAINRGR